MIRIGHKHTKHHAHNIDLPILYLPDGFTEWFHYTGVVCTLRKDTLVKRYLLVGIAVEFCIWSIVGLGIT